MRRLRARDERGVVIIEFAFVIPILLLMFLALADFALAELSDAAGSNAAREGARKGILYYDGAAGTTGSTSANFLKISAAVSAKLAGNVKGTPTVTVRCLNPDGTARSSCSTVGSDVIDLGRDLIEVSVTWDRKGGITGFVGSGFRTDKAIMRIVGTPPNAGSPPPACTFTATSATPSSVVQTNGDLPLIVFLVTVSAVADCGTPLLTFPAEAAYSGAQTMGLVSGNNFTFTMPATQGNWSAGTKTVTASANGGSVTQAITFDVVNGCLITATSPVTAQQSGGKLTTPTTFNASISSLAACGIPTITFPTSTGMGTQTMTLVSGTAYMFQVGTTQGTWSAQTYAVTVDGNGGASAPISFIVSAAPVCTLSNLTPNPATITIKKKTTDTVNGTVTFQVTRSILCGTPTIKITPGPSGSSPDLTTPQAMSCPALTPTTCTYSVQDGTRGWNASPSSRTVTITDPSGVVLTGVVNMVQAT